jgi:arabinoxylan arabinofuranohydrolase
MSSCTEVTKTGTPNLSDPTPSANERRTHNPILPLHHYVPDVEARVYDERVYLYGSLDLFGHDDWCSHQYRVFSASVEDLSGWTDHGVSFQSKPTEDDPRDDVPWSDEILYAPDAIRIDDLYYLAFCMAGGGVGLATSAKPEGPFTDAVDLVFEDGTSIGSIDPTLFVDDDGQPYIYWGQGDIRGAKLEQAPDGRWTGIDQSSYNEAVLHHPEHGSGEGASMRKIGDTYYLAFADDLHPKGEHAIGYSVSKDPLQGFTYAGAIVHNRDCDVAASNNHGSICQINGQWYVFYHRQSNATSATRRVCVEPIALDENGRFGHVEMTCQGFGGPLDAYARIQAAWACRFTGPVNKVPNRYRNLKRAYNTQWSETSHGITNAHNGNTASFKYLDFGEGHDRPQCVHARVRSKEDCAIAIRLDAADGPVVGTLPIAANGGVEWVQHGAALEQVLEGVHAVYLEFTGVPDTVLCEIESFQFSRSND